MQCPFCGSKEIIKKGKRKLSVHGLMKKLTMSSFPLHAVYKRDGE